MKYKANILINENHKFITMIPLQPEKHTYYILKTKNNHLLVEPYLNIENENILLGRELASILEINQNDELEIEPFTGDILSLDTLHIKVNKFFDHNKLQKIPFINSLRTTSFEIDLDDKFYKVENTKIFFSNCELSKVYGHDDDIANITKLVYGSLFCDNELSECHLKQNNVFIVKGNKKLRISDIMHNVAYNLRANYYFMPKDVQATITENLMFVYEFDQSDIYASISNVKKYEHKNVLFVFIVNDDEHKEKLLAYFDTNLCYDVSVPVARKDGRLIKEMLSEIPHKITQKEMNNLYVLLNRRNLFELQDILTRVLSKANYEKRVDMKMDGYFVVYRDFIDILERFYTDENKGFVSGIALWLRRRFM